ncbi:SRPBCC family protein [Amycolatopsis jejuensis]|uniref:SRPBCC family protein n=1 Tax=Amycolatopsis jejuensis TaxID=330084 RepID=UPI0005256AD2|nr:SRPBCC family protein [Amycolatopsis jejuensis]
MILENEFTIDAPLEKAWQALNNPELVAPCFPGANLSDYAGDTFTGMVKVKLGPISLTYQGEGTYVERDDAAHTIVIAAKGRDARGNGTASARVTGEIVELEPGKCRVGMRTDLSITGRPAQFGRGVITDVADSMVTTFAGRLAETLSARAPEAPVAEIPQVIEDNAISALDLVPARVKRAAPVVGAVLVVTLLWRLLRRR